MVTLKGNVILSNNQPLNEGVVLLIGKDSTLYKSGITEKDGTFQFEAKNGDSYFLQATSEEGGRVQSELFLVQGNTVIPALTIPSKETKLDGVEVVAKKPFIERQQGKTVLNIDNSIYATGSSAFELLEKAPGVTLTSSDNIILNGKSGIMVQIDGKNTPMSGADLANYLRGIPSNAIDKIELITNPSAKYDAAGSAIINIKLKKDTRSGTNGTISMSYGQGVYPKTNDGISLNHRNKKINLFGSYNFAYRKAFNHLVLERRFYDNDTFKGAYLQDNYLTFPFKNHVARVGMDVQLNKKSSLGVVVSGVSNRFNPNGFNSSDVLGSDGLSASRFETTNDSQDKWYNAAANVNYKRTMDTMGSEWTVDLDYARYGNNTKQLFTTRYFDLNNNEYLSPYLLAGDLSGALAIHSLKTDYHHVMTNDRSLDGGLKSSYVEANNNLKFYDRSFGYDTYDSTKSNHFIYKEQIHAAYVSYNQRKGKWNLQLGLRAEYTGVSGIQKVYGVKNDTSYLQFFPNVMIGRQLDSNQTMELSYSRRIDRPGYDQLNPFKFYLDPSTYKEGNPYLRPQTTHTIELGHFYKERIYTQLGISRTVDNITEVIAPLSSASKVTVQTNRNLAQVDLIYLNVSAPLQLTKWWMSTNNLNAFVALYSGNIANTQITNQGNFAYSVNTQNAFTIGKTWSAELNGNYQSPQIYAFDRIKQIYSIGCGIQKKVAQNRGTIRLNITDIFFTSGIRANVSFTDYTEYFDVKRETRVATLSFSYKFGKASVPMNRRRGSGADDLKSRVNNSGVG